MRRPFSTLTAILLLGVALLQSARLWFGWPVTVGNLPVSTTASWALIGVALALAVGLWFEARMHAHLAYGRRGEEALADAELRRSGRGETFRAPKPFTVRKGRRYRATIVLGFFEQVASNDTIAGMLGDAGFDEVTVSGSGSRRMAEALWSGDDTTADMPSQVVSAVEMPPTIGASAEPKPASASAPTPTPPQPRPTSPPAMQVAAVTIGQPVADGSPGASPRPTMSAAAAPPPPIASNVAPQSAFQVADATDATRRPSLASRFSTALAGRQGTSPTPPAPPPAPGPVPQRAAQPLRLPDPPRTPEPLRATPPASMVGSVPSIRTQKPPTDTAS